MGPEAKNTCAGGSKQRIAALVQKSLTLKMATARFIKHGLIPKAKAI
jgi:hypothetical protein